MKNILIVAQVVVSIILILAVLAQPAKTQGFSLMTGTTDTFFSKNKTKTFESTMSKITIICAVIFAAITLSLNLV